MSQYEVIRRLVLNEYFKAGSMIDGHHFRHIS